MIKLLRMLCGDLGPLGWPDWCLAPDGLLYPPEHVQGVTQRDVSGLWWLRHFYDTTSTELGIAQRELALMRQQIWVLHAHPVHWRAMVLLCEYPFDAADPPRMRLWPSYPTGWSRENA